MLYNIYFEAAAIAFLAVLNVYIRLQYNTKAFVNKECVRLATILLIAVTLDVITAITISFASVIPIWINMTINFLYLCSDSLLEYQFVMYCMNGEEETKHRKRLRFFCRGMLIVSILVLAANFFTGWVFSFDETGYVHGPIYYIIFIIPVFFIVISCILLGQNAKRYRKNQKIGIVFYMAVALSGPVIQLFIAPDVLLILFMISIGFTMMLFTMETPDYQALMQTLEELKQTRDEAEESMAEAQNANQAKNRFLTGMSHEIRTPINAILGYNEMIMRASGDPEIERYAVNVQTAGKTLLSIVGDILDYTEIENGRFEVEPVAYSTLSMLMDVITYAEYYVEKKSIELRLDIAEDIPRELFGAAPRLTQIMNNLISNAIKYTESGYVEIGVKWEGYENDKGSLWVYVKDTGIGMREEDVARISSSFLRMDEKRTQNVQGIGLGLTIVTRLLYLMGSELVVESEYEKGTTMSFSILQEIVNPEPVGKIDPSLKAENAFHIAGEELYTAPEARVLAVDDNAMNLNILKGGLKQTRAIVDTAQNGAEALALIDKNHYDIIFLDHMMPVMDGIETLKTIKKQRLCPGVPIIALTANAVTGEKNMYLNAGFDEYLSKPVTSRQLRETLRRLLPDRFIHIEEPVVRRQQPEEVPKDEAEGKTPVERLSFLDTKSGIAYCCDNEEFYLEIVNTYIKSDKTEAIRGYLSEKDWENYRIVVHALKGTSRTIGAEEMSKEAEKLEAAVKKGDTAFAEENTEAVLEHYRLLMKKISEALSAPDNPAVLLADGDAMYRLLTEKMLGGKYAVKAVRSGSEAFAALEKQLPAVVLLETRLAGMSGLKVLEKMRSDERYKDVPVIFVAADGGRDTEQCCLSAGAFDFIAKPVTAEVLMQRVNRATMVSLSK